MTQKPCDRAFDQAEKAFRKASDNLAGAAIVCIRQAASDLSRACRLFRDPDVGRLGAVISESLKGEGNLVNVWDACNAFASPRRAGLDGRNLSPNDLLVVAAINLEEACRNLLASGEVDLAAVGPDTVRSRSASEEILQVLHAR